MKLENIFGLHLGCMVECGKERFIYDKIDNGFLFSQKYGRIFTMTHCKIILKPLTAIADEDVEEIEKHFLRNQPEGEELVCWSWDPNLEGFLVDFKKWGDGVLFESTDTMFLFASLGYDVGVVPDEHKIIDGG